MVLVMRTKGKKKNEKSKFFVQINKMCFILFISSSNIFIYFCMIYLYRNKTAFIARKNLNGCIYNICYLNYLLLFCQVSSTNHSIALGLQSTWGCFVWQVFFVTCFWVFNMFSGVPILWTHSLAPATLDWVWIL